MVLYPLSSFVLLFGFVVYWLFAAVYLFSSGEIKKRDCTSTWMTDNMGGDASTVMEAADLPCGCEPLLRTLIDTAEPLNPDPNPNPWKPQP